MFGQVVVGPPGSGKSTYCNGMQQFLTAAGRKVVIVNLDPANDSLPYECAINIMDLISLEEVMNELNLGPNGDAFTEKYVLIRSKKGLMYCMDHLEQNLDWLKDRLDQHTKDGAYLIFDCPGQVELLTLHHSLQKILQVMQNKWNYRLAALHLVDSNLCSDANQYISALLLSLSVMLSLEMPHINVLSKIDLIESQGDLAFNLDFYSEVQDLSYLLDTMEDGIFTQRFQRLSKALCEVVEDYGMVQFTPLAIENKEMVARVVALVDKATGYVFTGLSGGDYPPEFLYGAGVLDEQTSEKLMSYEEKYMKGNVQQ